ncbi:MAG: HTTM domain-containing protein [Candidatus Eremiobacterota bacterium]
MLRIAVGLIVVVDLAIRATDLVAHYTDAGVLPRADLIATAEEPLWFSVHMGSGQWPFQAALFLVAGLAGAALCAGYRTRWATLVSWFMLCSLQARNPVVLNSGDALLRLLLFWGIFLPWGECWSMDRRGRTNASQVATAGTAAYALQIALVYLSAGLHKSGQPWREGTAVYYALSIDQYVTPVGTWLLQFPALLSGLTYATVAFQLSFPLLLTGGERLRTLAVVGSVLLHLGIGSCLHLGIFSGVATVAAVGLLPAWFWQRLEGLWPRLRAEPGSSEPPTGLPRPMTALVLVLMVASAVLNAANLWPAVRLSPTAAFLPRLLRLEQYWGMFAPRPLADDGWYVPVGILRNGKQVDLRNGGEVRWDKPARLADTYPNERWRKYQMALYELPNSPHRKFYCRYLGSRWNASHRGPWRVATVDLFFVRERTLDGYRTADPERIRMFRYDCPEDPREGFRELFQPRPPRQ